MLVVFCFSTVIDRGIFRAVVASVKSLLFVLNFYHLEISYDWSALNIVLTPYPKETFLESEEEAQLVKGPRSPACRPCDWG